MYRRIYRLIEDSAKYQFVHYLSADLARTESTSDKVESVQQSPLSRDQFSLEQPLDLKMDLDHFFSNDENRSDLWLEQQSFPSDLQLGSQQPNFSVNNFIQLESDSRPCSNSSPVQTPIVQPTDQVLKYRISELERRIDSLEAERLGVSTTQHTSAVLFPEEPPQAKIRITDYSPEWDYVDGGSKMMLCYQPMIEITQGYVLFGEKWTEAICVQPGVLKCHVPKHEEGCVKLSILLQGQRVDDKNDRPSFFEFRKVKKPKKTSKSGKNMLTEDQSYCKLYSKQETVEGEFKVRVIEKLSSMQSFLQQFQPSTLMNPQMEYEQLLGSDDQQTQNKFLSLFDLFTKVAESLDVPQEQITQFLNLSDSTGFSLIHYLTALGYQQIIKYLLKFNIDINTVGVDGLTPLQIAILLNQENMVSFLIQQGAIDAKQVDPLFKMESVYKNRNILDLLIRGVTLCDSINNSSSLTDQISWNDQEQQEDSNYFNLEELCDQIFMEHHMSEPLVNPQDQKLQDDDDDEKGIKLKYILGQVKSKHHKYYRNYSKQKHQDHIQDSSSFTSKLVLESLKYQPNDNYQDHVKIIQKNVRAWLLRRQYLDMKYATTVLQNYFRQKLAKKDFNHPDCKQKIKDTLRNWLNLKQM